MLSACVPCRSCSVDCSLRCCIHFLALPIEDPVLDHFAHTTAAAAAHSTDTNKQPTQTATALLDSTTATSTSSFSSSSSPSPPTSLPLPFADTANPILAQVAFLASTVSPAVAAAAAQAAIQYYTHNADDQHTDGRTGARETVNGQKERSDGSDNMDTADDREGGEPEKEKTAATDARSTATSGTGRTTDDTPSKHNTTQPVSQSTNQLDSTSQ